MRVIIFPLPLFPSHQGRDYFHLPVFCHCEGSPDLSGCDVAISGAVDDKLHSERGKCDGEIAASACGGLAMTDCSPYL